MRVGEIQKQVGRGEYRVDAQAVADAILRRIMQELKLLTTPKRDRG